MIIRPFVHLALVALLMIFLMSASAEERDIALPVEILGGVENFDLLMKNLAEPILSKGKKESNTYVNLRVTVFPPFSLPYVVRLESNGSNEWRVIVKELYRSDCAYPIMETCSPSYGSYFVQASPVVVPKSKVADILSKARAVKWERNVSETVQSSTDGDAFYVLEMRDADGYRRAEYQGLSCWIFSSKCKFDAVIESLLEVSLITTRV